MPGRGVGAQQLRGEVPERADHARLDQLELAVEPVLAGVDLARERVAVAGRPAHQRVRDEDVRARQADLVEQLLEQPPGLADERQALLVLVRAGRLADEHQVGVGVARAEDDRVARRRELRAAACRPAPAASRLELLAPRLRRGHAANDSSGSGGLPGRGWSLRALSSVEDQPVSRCENWTGTRRLSPHARSSAPAGSAGPWPPRCAPPASRSKARSVAAQIRTASTRCCCCVPDGRDRRRGGGADAAACRSATARARRGSTCSPATRRSRCTR